MPQTDTLAAAEECISSSLTLSSTLRDLRIIDFGIDVSHTGEKLFQAFQQDDLLAGIILTRQSNLRAFVSRRKFLEIISRPFGREIFLKRSLDVFIETNSFLRDNVTILSIDMPIFEAARICLQRPSELLYEPIVVDIGEQNYRVLALQELLVAQSKIYQVAMLTIQERSLELATANEEIIALNERLKQENLRMGAELDVARQIQMMILPKSEELENIAGLDLAGYMEPADEVGGDYYDVLEVDGVVTLGIGDVTGHGLESGILMLMTQTVVRTLQEIGEVDPVKFLDALNRTIYKNVQRMNSEKSLTLAIVNYAAGKISISGQHEEILVVRGGKVERIDTMDLGFPIGLDAEIAAFIHQVTFDLHPSDGVVLYTDGIPEASDIHNVQYGVERLCAVISENWHKTASEIKDSVIADLRRHIGTQKVFDDITLLVLKRNASNIANPQS
jgi:serine phosphatase RsbU (regulator of sigma subunit)